MNLLTLFKKGWWCWIIVSDIREYAVMLCKRQETENGPAY